MVAIIIAQIIYTRSWRRVINQKRTVILAKYLPSDQTDNLTRRQNNNQTGEAQLPAKWRGFTLRIHVSE